MQNREFLMLAHNYSKRYGIGGWYMSEKLDGRRAWWDGGITRGMVKSSAPWANTDKDTRYKETQYCTGLWSRYGNIIHAPTWWLNQMPRIPLDGELYCKGMPRQDLMSATASLVGGDWSGIQLHCFDMPAYESVMRDGRINNPNYKKIFLNFMAWVEPLASECVDLDYRPSPRSVFETVYMMMENKLHSYDSVVVHQQVRLPFHTTLAQLTVERELEIVTATGGEGLIVRDGHKCWTPKRMHHVLKVKKLQDAEGTVIGYTTGRGKLLGLMGALILDVDGVRLEISGFSDRERVLSNTGWAIRHPGVECPPDVVNPLFPSGSRVTFKYRGTTKDGVPQEARYWRKR